MLVPAARMDEAIEAAQSVADKLTVGAPDSGARLGPVVSQAQFDKIQTLIQSGIDAGATVAFGGTGRPDGLSEGYYVRPTVFANVDNNMEVARTEIFGPVLVIIGYDDVDDAVAIPTTPSTACRLRVGDDTDAVRSVASRIRAGQIFINGPDPTCPHRSAATRAVTAASGATTPSTTSSRSSHCSAYTV